MVDKTILGFMEMITPPEEKPFISFNYYTFLSNMMDAQLSHFEDIKTFRYQAHLVCLTLKQNIPYFYGYGLQNQDVEGNILPTIGWLPIIRRKSKGEDYVNLIIYIMQTIYFLIRGHPPPRVITDMGTLIHLTPKVAVGDWYLFATYTILRIY